MGDREIVMTRVFSAPAARVFEGLTTPALLRQWLAVRGMTITSAVSEPRVGGRYRFEATHRNGQAMAWGGEVRELVPNQRIVQTEAWDAYPGEAINTTTLEERDGKTTMTVRMEYPTREIRDAVLEMGMPEGAGEAYDKLEQLLTAPRRAAMQLATYLNYRGTCEEAFNFYAKHLGGTITTVMRHQDVPGAQTPPEWGGKILHAQITIAGSTLMGADIPSAEPMRSAYLALTVDTAAEAERVFALLTDGGEVFMKMEETFFAERFAMFRDRFGTSWMLQGAPKA